MKIKRNQPLAKSEKPRTAWPFADMKVNDVVDIVDRNDWERAQQYAHTFGHAKGWTFSTQWLNDESKGRIRRVS